MTKFIAIESRGVLPGARKTGYWGCYFLGTEFQFARGKSSEDCWSRLPRNVSVPVLLSRTLQSG